MIKKIGILNFHYSNYNYGAVLQASALTSVVKDLGYDVEHINFIPLPSFKKKLKIYSLWILRQLGLRKKAAPNPVVLNSKVFEVFRNEWIKCTSSTYSNIKNLAKTRDQYGAVIVGSDQVWRPEYTGEHALAYFLSFVDSKCLRISYAASFGVDYWKEPKIKGLTLTIKEELEKFNSISVREKSGVTLCEDIFKVKAQHVLDPTLLVGKLFFEDIINKSDCRDKIADIVYYKLDLDSDFLDDIRKISEKLNYTDENIYYSYSNGKYYYHSVADWLKNIKDSKLVITDSFHCVCLSILFEKQFIYSANEARGITRATA